MLLSADKLAAATGCGDKRARVWAEPLSAACDAYEIDSAPRLSAFLAQVGHESGGLSQLVENLNYSAEGLLRTWPSRFTDESAPLFARQPEKIANHVYGGRMGNHEPNDGWQFRGRGLIQVTGRANYEAVTELLLERLRSTPDFVLAPELLEAPKWAAYSAAAYWNDHDLNSLADSGDFARITARINGGQNGRADRQERYQLARKALA